MYAELNIRSAGFDADLADHGYGRVAHGLVLAVGEGLRRRHRDRVAGVHPHGIEVLDRADDDDVVFEVAHDLELVLFPSQHGFFNQGLVNRGEIEAAGEHFEELFAIVGHASARSAEREAWPHDDRESNLAGEFETVSEIVDQRRLGNIEADLLHGVFKVESVLGFLDGFHVGANQLHVELFEHAIVGQLDGEVERGLAADGGKNGKSRRGRELAFDANDLFQIFASERLDVGTVGKLGIGHDGGRVRVGEHDFVALRFERLASLGTGVVELGGLSDDDRTRADNEYLRDVSSFGHRIQLSAVHYQCHENPHFTSRPRSCTTALKPKIAITNLNSGNGQPITGHCPSTLPSSSRNL